MYCPQCHSEYREGFEVCSECRIPLVSELPEEDEESSPLSSGLNLLLETTHPTSLDELIVRMEEAGIPYVVQSGTALSLVEESLFGGALPEDWRAIVLVPREYYEQAKKTQSEAEKAVVASSTEENEEEP